jgi:hypothetical protein
VLAGLVKDTYKFLCQWLRREFAATEGGAQLLDLSYEPNWDGNDGELLLELWCGRAHITSRDQGLILATRVRGVPLSELAPAQSRPYYRLRKRRSRAEARLKAWLMRHRGR